MTVHGLVLPLTVTLPRKTKADLRWTLNLNAYRNTHHQILNNAKIAYKELIRHQIAELPKFNKISLTLTLFPKTKRLTDLDNICSIHAKFLLDALVELGRLQDDNYLYVPEISFRFGEVDKGNPRVEAIIKNMEGEIW